MDIRIPTSRVSVFKLGRVFALFPQLKQWRLAKSSATVLYVTPDVSEGDLPVVHSLRPMRGREIPINVKTPGILSFPSLRDFSARFWFDVLPKQAVGGRERHIVGVSLGFIDTFSVF